MYLQSERRPHALAYVETAMRLGSVINTCETADELSRCLGGSKTAEGKAKMESIKPELGPGLPGSSTELLGSHTHVLSCKKFILYRVTHMVS